MEQETQTHPPPLFRSKMAAQGSAATVSHPAEPTTPSLAPCTSTSSAAAAAQMRGTVKPRYWCDLCEIDCQSAVNVRGHQLGSKHRKRAGLPKLSLTEQMRRLEGWKEGDDIDDETLANIDLSRMDDMERMWQREYDDAVVELALFNYASYHGTDPGQVTFAQVRDTSAGITGWAAACLGNASGGDTAASAVATTPPAAHGPVVKSDEEEARQLQAALLESVGAHPATQIQGTIANLYSRRDDDDDDDDSEEEEDNDDNTSYKYDEDSDTEEEEEGDCLSTSADGSTQDGESSAWSLMSHTSTSSSYVMPDLASSFSVATALGSL